MRFLYQSGVNFYWLLVRIFSLFKPKAKVFIKGRKHWKEHLSNQRLPDEKYLWIHCASLGEFEQGRPLIEAIKKQYPQQKICLSFFSPSGYEIRKDYQYADIVCYLPKDSKRNARNFIEILKPEAAVFVKYEYWYHYLNTLNKADIPTYLISAIFRKKQIFFQWYGSFFRKMLSLYHAIFVQDEASLQYLTPLNLSNINISGDTRFDRVWEITGQSFNDSKIDGFVRNQNCLVAGSTWAPDETLLLELMRHNPKVKLILAPHETDHQHIQQILQKFQDFSPVLYRSNQEITDETRVLIINTIGILSSLYRFGNIAYIGGGFGKGIHNILEAACYGVPVIFGTNYTKFKEAVELIHLKAAFSVKNSEELISVYNDLMLDNAFEKQGEIAKQYVDNKRGATKKILKYLQKDIKLS